MVWKRIRGRRLHVKKRHRCTFRLDGLKTAPGVGYRLAALLHRGVEAFVIEVELIEAGVERARDVALDKDVREVVDVAKADELEDLLLGLEPRRPATSWLASSERKRITFVLGRRPSRRMASSKLRTLMVKDCSTSAW